ncbi:MAG: glycosyltransferase, partial [Actinomycetes bacterium]
MTGAEEPTSWTSRLRQGFDDLAPAGTQRRKAARVGLAALREARAAGRSMGEFHRVGRISYTVPFDYPEWLVATRPNDAELAALSAPSPAGTCWGVTVVVLPGAGRYDRTADSIAAQLLAPTTVLDHHADTKSGWAAAADAFDSAPADHFVVLLRSGDHLEPDALLRIVDRASADPHARVVTWDDDVWSGRRPTDPQFRPVTYSPELLVSANPFGYSVAIAAAAARAAGGVDATLGADAVWDLLLRLDLHDGRATHLPHVLSHLHERPPAVGLAGVSVVQAHLDRRGLPATAERVRNAVHVRWRPTARQKVSLLVPTRHNQPLVGQLIDSLRCTEYPDWELVVVDNGGRTADHERFYETRAAGIDHTVLWWDDPFNYGAVNNAAARSATGDVLVLLNDDTVVHSPNWLDELVGWLSVPGVGTVGVQMIDGEGTIQHGGVIIGAAGLADHRFQGMPPHSWTLTGSTDWYRNSVANTGACVAITADLWRDIGGLDERYELCGSDVVLGLEAMHRGLRNVCTPAIRVDHLESATRKTHVPEGDVFASYWPYARHLRAGDPFHNPNVSLIRRTPSLRAPDEPTALERIAPALGRGFGGVFQQVASRAEADRLAAECRVDDDVVAGIEALHDRNAAPIDVQTVNWFVPTFDNPFYGGLATIFRIANLLRTRHGVRNTFVVNARPNEPWFRSGLAAIFPGLEESGVVFCPTFDGDALAALPAADVSIATQWDTAYQVAHSPNTRRKYYLVQDFEPMFHPAGTIYALAEETYRLGLEVVCNTEHLLEVVGDRYGATGSAFTPAVDGQVFHAADRPDRTGEPLNVFVYARPGHWRNCWELAEPALHQVKERFGREVRIVTAGAWQEPGALAHGIDHLGLLDYGSTGALYRTCDLALSLTVSEHPSYLPLELMACGVPVVAFDLRAGGWIFRDGENCLLARRTVDSLVDRLTRLIGDERLRDQLRAGGLAT